MSYILCVCLHSKLLIHCARERLFHALEFFTYVLGVNSKVKRVVRKYVLVSAATIVYIFRYIKCGFVCDGLSYGSHKHRQPTHMQQRNVTITTHDGTNKPKKKAAKSRRLLGVDEVRLRNLSFFFFLRSDYS